MKRILNLFSVPVLETAVTDVNNLNKDLISSIEELFALDDSKRILSHMWKNNLQANVKSELGYSSFAQLNFTGNWRWENAWCNVYPLGAYVPLHDHRGVHWSGVYYVQAEPACGELLLIDPKEYALANEPDNTLYRGNKITNFVPQPGKLVMFPGYLKHESEPNQSDKDRIIISFNINCHAD
jgi:hypothetical protein